MTSMSKSEIKRLLDKGDYSRHPKSGSNLAVWWVNFDRICNAEGKYMGFVQCRHCSSLLAYDPKKTGTSTLSTHANGCRGPASHKSRNIATMLGRSTTATVSAETKRTATEALAELCARDMRPFDIVTGVGFRQFCQALVDICQKIPEKVDIQSLLPDPTTISRRLQSLAESKLSVEECSTCVASTMERGYHEAREQEENKQQRFLS